jgi:hypothetical protein
MLKDGGKPEEQHRTAIMHNKDKWCKNRVKLCLPTTSREQGVSTDQFCQHIECWLKKSDFNPLALELNATCTLQKTQDLNDHPLICTFLADK